MVLMSTKPRLLVVEDETPIRIGLTDVFVYHGFDVTAVADGEAGWEAYLRGRFDLLLLDLMLPGIDGMTLTARVRERDRAQPVVMLTARGTDEDIVEGLKLGADDYVTKPFSIEELVLRVQAVLRRTRGPEPDPAPFDVAGLHIDPSTLSATVRGETIPFTRREMALLVYLADQTGRAVTREELLTRVWGYRSGTDVETRTVDIHIAKLRRKLERDPKCPEALVTVRGAGYRLVGAKRS